jgi:hypothetical protein
MAPPAPVPKIVSGIAASKAMALPLAFIAGLLALAALPSIRENPRLLWSFLGAAIALTAWAAVLFTQALRQGREFTLEIVLRKQHYLQACMQGTVILTWGFFWRTVYDAVPLIVAQLLFAFAFDILLAWSRRDTYTLGFGPFPVIFSINLFLWFKKDWFYLQFLLVAVGFAAKELIRWTKDGRRVHIFNPSSFPLAVFSLALFLLNKDGISWGPEIADTQNWPPYIYLVMFLVGLPGQFLFGVTTMTMSAMLTTVAFSQIYFMATGSYFFLDAHVPIAVFLGMTLLFTDPSTSPRTELGRIIFGISYGLSAVFLFWILQEGGKPTFYDKLLQVPILNLSILLIDRIARSKPMRFLDPARLGPGLPPRRRNLVYMSIWVLAFAGMYAGNMVGDKHPGQWISFWQGACERDARKACQVLGYLEHYHCGEGSGWACNEEGLRASVSGGPRAVVGGAFDRGCKLGFSPACTNLNALLQGGTFQHAPPALTDFPILLRGRKAPITERDPKALYARACEQGWPESCGR